MKTRPPPPARATPVQSSPQPASGKAQLLLRVVYLLLLLFGFLVAIETMSKAIKALSDTGLLGSGDEGELFAGVSNPFAGLALGVLFTVMVQSSSTTTATIVAVVGSGALSVEHAVPMVMGANIGTTITNTLVSIGHMRRAAEFSRAFAAATVHDFFNLLAVAILLPVELMTGALSRTAASLTGAMDFGGGEYKSPIKKAIKAAHGWLKDGAEGLGLEGNALGIVLLLAGIGLTFLCLFQITRNMRRLLAGRIEAFMNRALEASAILGIAIGTVITVSVQSSSITTSLIVPLCGAGVITLENAFPIMLGANLGTTITAVLASLAQDSNAALTIALVHVLFNLSGIALIYPVRAVRGIPLSLSKRLAVAAVRNRLWVLAYVVGTFVILPLAGWFFWKGVA